MKNFSPQNSLIIGWSLFLILTIALFSLSDNVFQQKVVSPGRVPEILVEEPTHSWEAEDGTITEPFKVKDGYIYQDKETTDPTKGGKATYQFTITNAGDYIVKATVKAPNGGADSFFVNIDAEPTSPTMIWDIAHTSSFAEKTVSWRGKGSANANGAQFNPKVFTLTAGEHTLIIRGREKNTQLDKISLIYQPVPTPTTTLTPTPTPVPLTGLSWEAEAGIITTPFVIKDGYVYQEKDTSGSGPTKGGKAVYDFQITDAGKYIIKATVKSTSGGANSFFINIDAEPTKNMVWSTKVAKDFVDQEVIIGDNSKAEEYDLTVGSHQLILRGREEKTMIDKIWLERVIEPTPTPTPTPLTGLSWEAETGTIITPFKVKDSYIYQDKETTDPTKGGKAAYTFTITNAGDYIIKTTVKAPSTGSNSFFVNIDGEPTTPTMIWDITKTSGFVERTVSWRGTGSIDKNQFNPKVFTLTAGEHTLIIRGREKNTLLDKISLELYSGTTPTPTPTGTLTPTPTPTPNASSTSITIEVKMAGITSLPNNSSAQQIKFYMTSISGGTGLGSASSPILIDVTPNDEGIFEGTLTLPNTSYLNNYYRIRIKGPKHKQIVWTNKLMPTGGGILDMTDKSLPAGDINSDGVVNSIDLALINTFTTDADEIAATDLNLDNQIDIVDKQLVLNTLSANYDEE